MDLAGEEQEETPLDVDLNLSDSNDLEEIGEFVDADDLNEIHHQDLAVQEFDDSELQLDDTPLDTESMDTSQPLSISAASSASSASSLTDITVASESDDLGLVMDSDISVAEGPQVSLQEIELADEAFAELEAADDGGSNETASAFAQACVVAQETQEEVDPEGLPLDDDLSEMEISISDDDLADDVSALGKTSNVPPPVVTAPAAPQPHALEDSVIDAGDVLKSAHVANSSNAQETDFQSELSASEEDEALARMTDCIESHEKESPDDLASHHNLNQGIDLLTSSEPSIDAEVATLNHEFVDENTSELSADSENGAFEDETSEKEFDVHDHLPLSEIVTTKSKHFTRKVASQNKKTPWVIASFDVDEQGCPIISWTNGVSVTVTDEAIAMGSVKIGGHDLRISDTEAGVLVEIDGVRMLLPAAA